MVVVTASLGLIMLTIGRQLFWVVVSGLGFAIGMNYATQNLAGNPFLIIGIGLVVGLIGAIVAYYIQRAAAVLAGFLAGWYLSLILVQAFDLSLGIFTVLLGLLIGILGMIFANLAFDWSLIVISTLVGATMIVNELNFGPRIHFVIFSVLMILGITIQGIFLIQDQDSQNSAHY